MPKLLIIDAFKLSIYKKNYVLLQSKIFSLKIWKCKILDKYHVWRRPHRETSQRENVNIHKLFNSCEPKWRDIISVCPFCLQTHCTAHRATNVHFPLSNLSHIVRQERKTCGSLNFQQHLTLFGLGGHIVPLFHVFAYIRENMHRSALKKKTWLFSVMSLKGQYTFCPLRTG